jgi:hypothetical protein
LSTGESGFRERTRRKNGYGEDYLGSIAVEAQLEDEGVADVYGNIIKQPVINVTGRNIDNVRIISADYFGCALPDDVARFQYEISLENKVDVEMVRRIGVRTWYERENKKLGLFGGTITGVRWTGGQLSELLNRDSDISDILLHCARSPGNPDFEVMMKSLNTAEIRGPRFADLQRIKSMFSRALQEGFEECVFGFKTADRIAGHVRAMVTTG